MAKEVSVGVKVKLEADAKEMQRIIDDLETRLSNIKPGTSLEKTLTKQLQQLKAQAGDFSLISGQQIINQSDLATAANIAKRFFRDVGRISDSYEKAPFSSLQFTDDQLKNLKKAEKALEDFKAKSKDSLSKKTTGEVFGKYAEDAKKIQQTSAKLQKSFAMDDSFEETKKRIQKSKEQAEKDVELTNKKLILKQDEKLAAESAKKTAEANFNQKKAELTKTYKLEESLQKKANLAKNISNQKQFKSQKEVKDFFDKELFTSSGAFKAGGQDKANQLLSWMGFKPEEIPTEAAKIKQKIRDEIINAPLSQSQEMTNKMQANAKKFLDKDYAKAIKDNETLIKKDQGYIEAEKALKNSETVLSKKTSEVDTLQTNLSTQQLIYQQIQQLETEIDALWQKLEGDEAADNKTNFEKLKWDITDEREKLKKQVQNNYTKQDIEAAAKVNQNVRGYKDTEEARLQAEQEAANFKANLQASIKHWMGAQQIISFVKRGVRQAYKDVQGLDKAMTNIAVVTDFSVSDLWGKINDYMQVAQQYGVTTQGVYEVSQLYYQQGLGEADVMAATTETLKMARIAGMQYSDAADGMTVAIRGFNMEMEEASRITDVYSKVAAITASDTQELVTAMSKTASSAASVGSSFEDTTAMLAVMIEATRESPQNIGSAMKSIISRYGEMTKGLKADSEGEEIDYNRVDTALKSVGISLKDAQGQFRNFNSVIFELADTWDTLDSVTQRYIATIFAGNRQQSRFLALVSNAERLREVSEAAADSEDAGLLQYSKTLDSLETKLNNIKTSFQQFYMSIINGDNVKGLLDFINDLIKGLNKLSKFTTILNLGSIISGIKIVLTLLTNTFSISFANIGAAWKKTLSEMTLFSQQESKKSGMVYGQGFQEGQQTALAIRGKRNFKINSSPLTGAALSIGGSIFSALGSKVAADNQTGGAILSGLGSGLSTGGMAIAFGLAPQVAVIAAAVSGILSIISSLPTNNEKLQEAFDKQVELTEESNIKRAETQNDYKTLKTSIDNIKELEKTKNESEENYEKWVKANNDLVAAYPTLFGYIDEAGNTIADLSNSSDLLKTSFENAAYAAKQYYQNEALRIEKELQLNKEYEYVFNGANPLNPKSWGQVGSIVGQLEAAQTNQVEGLVEWSLYSNQFGLSSKEIAQRLEELGLTAQELLLEGITDSFSSFQSQQLFAALRNAGAITGNEKDEFSFESHFQSYLLAEQQLQDLYATKEQAMQSGVKFASLQSEMDDSIESYKNYSDIIVQLAKISYGDDLSRFDYSTLVNLTEDSYNELITPFLELYSTLSEGKREILSELGQNLTKYTPQDLIKLFTEEFGSSVTNEVYLAYANLWGKANSREIGKLVEGALPDGSQIEYSFDGEAWKEEYIKGLREGTIKLPRDGSYAKFAAMNPILMATTSPFDQETINEEYYEYLANLALWEEQMENDFSSVRTRDFLDFSQWLKDDIGKEYSQKDSSVQYEAYMNYVGDYVSRIYEELHPDNILRLIFDEAGNLRIALDAAKSLMNFSAERDKIIGQSSSVSAREAAKNQKKELLKVAAEIDLIDFSKKDWIDNEILLNFITGGLSELTEQDLLELQKLLLSENVGTSDWEKDLLAFGKSKNIQLVDLNKYIYEYVFTKINTIIGSEEEFIENFEGLFSKQQEGFTLEEADKIASQLKSTREKEFKISEGKLVLKDFEKAIDVLYQSKVTEIEEITDDINAISEATKTSEFKQLFKDSDQLSKKTLDGEAFTSLALEKQKNLKAEFERYYQEIAEISDSSGMADATVKYLVDTTDASLEGFINFLKTQAESNALVADYYNALIKELEQNKFLEDLIKGYEGSDKEKLRIEALETLKSTGGEALSAEQLGKVQYGLFGEDTAQYLKVRDNFDGTFTISAEELARVSEEASNIANNIALDKIDAVTEGLMALGKSVANKEVLTTEEKQKILGEEFNNQSKEAIETYWNYYENALSSGDYSELEKVLSIVYGEKKSKEMIARFKDDIEENVDNLLEWQLDLLEGTISHENLNKLSSQDSSFVESYDQAITLSAGKRASAIFSLYEQTYTKQLAAGDITASEALENTAKAASQQLDEWLGTSLTQFNKEATQGIEEGDLTQTTDEFGQLFVSTRKNAEETLESFYNAYSKGITDAGEIILDVQKLRADNRISEQEYAKFQRNFAEETFGSAEDLITRMASKDDVYADEIESFFEALGAPLQEGEAELLLQGGVQTFLSKIESTLLAAGVPQSDIDSRLAEIQAQLVDLLLESISSGISSLGEGIEGTLSAADYQSLAKKYDLTGIGTSKSSKGIHLGTADQQKLISQMFLEAQNAGLSAEFGDQLWEVWRDSTEDTVDGYTVIEKEIAKAKAGQTELTGETKAYVEALQQARAAAMFDEDAAEFAFMEQDATDGLTKNFDKFVDNIDKVKDAFSAFKSKEAIGYQDFYNMMDYMNKFGANGEGTNSFIQQIEKAGYTYEDFVNSVVANTDKWGKVDIGGIAAEMGISVDAAMTGMAEGMEEALKEVAQQQIKYLSALEKMLEALLILEQVGNINMSIALDYDGDGNPDKIISDLTQLSEEWQSIKDDEKKRLVFEVAIENKFAEIGKAAKQTGKNNLFTHILDSIFGADGYTWENGKLDFSLTDSNIQDVENSLVALQTLASKYSEIIGNRELTPLQAQSLASQLMNGLIDEEGNIIGTWKDFVDNILAKLEKTDLDNITLEAPVELKTKVTQAGADSPISIGEDGSISLNDNFTLEQANEFVAEFGIKLVPKEEGSTDLLIQELVGTEAEGEAIDGGETPVKINPQWELADGSAGTLAEAITDAANAEGTTIAPEIPIDPKLFLKEGSTAVTTFINDLITLLKGEPFEPELNADGTVNPSGILLTGAKAVITTLISIMEGESFRSDLDADGAVEPSEALLAGAKAVITTLVSTIKEEPFEFDLDANGTIDPSELLLAGAKAVITSLISTMEEEPFESDLDADGTVEPSSTLLESAKQVITSLVASMIGETFDADLNADGTVTPAEALTASAIQIVTDLEEKLTTDIPAKFTATGNVTYDSDGASAAIIEEIKTALGEDLVVKGVPITVDGKTRTGELTIGEAFTEADISEDGKTITGVKIKVDGETETGEISIEDFLAAVKAQVESSPTSAATVIDATLTKGQIIGADTLVQALLASIPDSTDKEVTINLKPVYSEDSLAGMSAQMFTDYLQSVVDSGEVISQSYFEALAGKFSSLESEGVGLTQYGMGGFDTPEQYGTSRELIQQIKGELVVDDSQAQSAITSAAEGSKVEVQVVAEDELEVPEPDPVEVQVEPNAEEIEDANIDLVYNDPGHEPNVEPNPTDTEITYTDPGHTPDVPTSVTVKIKYEDPGAPGSKWRGDVNNITGSAFANGNMGVLNAGAKLANKTLVGELGPELAVYNGMYHLLGQSGAEFVDLPEDALVFNHLQTRGIINGQMKNARAQAFKGRADAVIAKATGSAMATGNVSGPALAGGIGGALEAVRRAKSVWQGLLNSLSAADLLGGGGGGGGGGGNDESLKAHIEDLQEWYNLSRKIADIEQQINTLLAKRENITDGHEYLKNLRATQALLEDQVNTQADLMRFQEKQLKAQADFINNHDIWSKFLNVDENGLLQYNEGNETDGGKGALKVLQDLNEMSGSQQVAYIRSLGYKYEPPHDDEEEVDEKQRQEEIVAKFYEELQKQIDDYDALHDTVAETTETLEELETEINEIEKEIRENEIELSQEIYDIIVDAWKENIDNLKEQNDLIKEANEAYAEGIQKALDAEREMYEQNQSIQEREQLQRQLSLLRRSGGSASEIADLEQELNDVLKEEYFSNQEKALETIRDANERQVELMERQVKMQEDALEYQQEQGVIWQKVYEVMQGTDAQILDFMKGNSTEFFEKSSLVQQDMLTEWAKMVGIYNEEKVYDYYAKQAEGTLASAWETETGKGLKSAYDAASAKDRENWNKEYYDQYAKALMEGATETEALTKAQEELYEHLEQYKKAMEEKAEEEKKKKSGGGGSSGGSGSKSSSGSYNRLITLVSGEKVVASYKEAKNLYEKGVATSTGVRTSAKQATQKEKAKASLTVTRQQVDDELKNRKSKYTGTINSIGPARYGGTLVGEFGMELGVWNDKWHLMGKNGPEMRNDIPSDALIFNHLQTAGILSGQYTDDFFSRKLSDIPNKLNDSYNSAIGGITNSNSTTSGINIEPGAIVLQVSQLNDRYDINELYDDITNKIYSVAAQSSGRGVSRR